MSYCKKTILFLSLVNNWVRSYRCRIISLLTLFNIFLIFPELTRILVKDCYQTVASYFCFSVIINDPWILINAHFHGSIPNELLQCLNPHFFKLKLFLDICLSASLFWSFSKTCWFGLISSRFTPSNICISVLQFQLVL